MSNPAAAQPPASARPSAIVRAPRERLWRHLVGEQFRSIRHSRGETLDEVARRAGVSTQYLSEIERGRKEPSSEVLQAVSAALEITLIDLTLGVADRLREERPATVVPRGASLVAYAVAA